jgi:hypothetical protein
MTTRLAALLVALLAPSVTRSDALTEAGQSACYEMAAAVNALADFTQTECLPAGGALPGTVSLIMLSSEPVFSSAASKKAWLVVVAAAVGKIANDRPRLKLDTIIVSDAQRISKREGFSLPARRAKTLQRQVHAGTIDLDQFYAAILKDLKPHNVKR